MIRKRRIARQVIHLFLLVFAALWVAPHAFAKPVTFFCEIKAHSRGGWIPASAVYAMDPGTGAIIASDKYIQYARKKAISAQVDRFGPDAFWFRYTLKLPAKGNKNLKATYTIRLNTRSLRMTIRASVGDDGSHRGSGTCKGQ